MVNKRQLIIIEPTSNSHAAPIDKSYRKEQNRSI